MEPARAATAVCSLPHALPGFAGTRLILRKSVRLDLRWGGLALPTGCRSELQPGGRFPIACDQPSERARGRLGLRRRRVATDSRMIFGLEFRRAELGAKADSRPLAYADIPNGPAVARRLAVHVERSRARHRDHQRTISLAGSSVVASLVDDAIRMTIFEPSALRISTSAAPACFAARIARATSACVIAAGRRLTIASLGLSWRNLR